jgi:DHA2 family multidrug resistance protein-like MFS transporter
MNETGSQFGFAFGIAALGSIGTAIYRHQVGGSLPARVPAGAAREATDTLAGATHAATGLPAGLARPLLATARAAYTTEMHVSALLSGILLAGVTVLTVALLRHVGPSGAPDPAEPAEPELAPASGR